VTAELPPSRWDFPAPDLANAEGLVGVGADLDPGSLLEGYRRGLFPMPLSQPQMLGWWSPDPRGVIPLDGLHVSRSLRSACRRFDVRVDTAFGEVVAMCADPERPGSWITPEFAAAYVHLHELGWAHSFEAWSDGLLAGGLYGVAIGGFFAGESMFHRVANASKVALVAAVETVRSGGGSIFDVQWTTPHLKSLGAVDLARADYLRLLESAVAEPTWLGSGGL
jgi:leucyl/phenylalanyl-tRNA--protein transferase